MVKRNKIALLVERSKQLERPAFSVADRVIEQIHSKQTSAINYFVFDIFAAIAVIVMSVLLFVGIQSWFYITSPLTRLYSPLSGVSLW